MQLYHVTVYIFPGHFLIHNIILLKPGVQGVIIALEAAAGEFFSG